LIQETKTRRKLMKQNLKDLKHKHKHEYSKIQKDVKKALRTDKRTYIDDLAERAEEAASKGEQENLFKITKIVRDKKRASPNMPIKDKAGTIQTSEKGQEAQWT
jgi:uncharacterized protein YbcC (UPF0753/DUF2309 family)